MPEIWLATCNPKKAQELRRVLPAGVAIRTLDELPQAEGFEPVEDGVTFRENAEKKAMATAALLARLGIAPDALVLADDSGLCVDALQGRPGVHSARYGNDDADRIQRLLSELAGVPAPARSACFVCSLVAVRVSGLPFATAEETCAGRILEVPRGQGGFGYDPVFAPDGAPTGRAGVSFGELSPGAKDAISHRGKALRAFAGRVAALLGSPAADRQQQ